MADMRVFASVLLLAYSVGWLFTQYLSSPLFAGIIGFATPYLVAGIAAAVLMASGEDMTALNGWVSLINLPIAVFCFSLGAWHYLRRVESHERSTP